MDTLCFKPLFWWRKINQKKLPKLIKVKWTAWPVFKRITDDLSETNASFVLKLELFSVFRQKNVLNCFVNSQIL